jgi:hypothetical protein
VRRTGSSPQSLPAADEAFNIGLMSLAFPLFPQIKFFKNSENKLTAKVTSGQGFLGQISSTRDRCRLSLNNRVATRGN